MTNDITSCNVPVSRILVRLIPSSIAFLTFMKREITGIIQSSLWCHLMSDGASLTALNNLLQLTIWMSLNDAVGFKFIEYSPSLAHSKGGTLKRGKAVVCTVLKIVGIRRWEILSMETSKCHAQPQWACFNNFSHTSILKINNLTSVMQCPTSTSWVNYLCPATKKIVNISWIHRSIDR
jgi:hypothetical protein